jgi:hypothetical protein
MFYATLFSQETLFHFSEDLDSPSSLKQMDADRDLYMAIGDDDLPRVQWLIQEGGANVNAEVQFGVTTRIPFLKAVQFCRDRRAPRHATLLWLVEHGGADVTLTDAKGRTVWENLD